MKKQLLTSALIFLSCIPKPANSCTGFGGSAIKIAITGNIIEFSDIGKHSMSGILIRIKGTDIFTLTQSDGSFKFTNIIDPHITLIFEYNNKKASLDLGTVDRTQVIRLYDIRINRGIVQVGVKKVEDLWERWHFREHEDSRPNIPTTNN